MGDFSEQEGEELMRLVRKALAASKEPSPIPRTHNKVGGVRCKDCGYAYTKPMHGQATSRGYRRLRRCLKCEAGFITYEVPAAVLEKIEKSCEAQAEMPSSECPTTTA